MELHSQRRARSGLLFLSALISVSSFAPYKGPAHWSQTDLTFVGQQQQRTQNKNRVRNKPTRLHSQASSDDESKFPAFPDGSDASALGSAEESELRRSEFILADEDLFADDERRRSRLERDSKTREKYAEYGDELWELRSKMEELSKELVKKIGSGDKDAEREVREKLLKAEARDPELMYGLETRKMKKAEKEGRKEDAEKHREEAAAARTCLPHLNLEGLWVGKYGSHGYEMINVTYVGDTLIAFKITGDKNVPKGEITFQGNLGPSKASGKPNSLKPIVLTENAAQKWGTKQLPRYFGNGQVAEEGFKNTQWMDGQLIIIGTDYFSFAWIPIGHQIFFGRPSPELSLKMLRDSGASSVKAAVEPPTMDDDVEKMKEYATRMLEATTATMEDDYLEGKTNPFGCIWHDEATEECYFE